MRNAVVRWSVGLAVLALVAHEASANCVLGDINQSGGVDAVDIQLVINSALGITVAFSGDINGDQKTDAIDVQLVINAALGLDISGQILDTGALDRVFVDANNLTGIEDGSQQHPFKAISHGATVVRRDGQIIVSKGTYAESVTLKKGVRLSAPDGAFRTRLTAVNGASTDLLNLGDGSSVQGLTIGGAPGTAISLCESHSAEISNCVIHTSGVGVRVESNASLILTNVTVHGNAVGVHAAAGASIGPVENCIFSKNGVAVDARLATWQGAYNAFFGNTTDITGFAHDPSDLLADPRYVAEDALNFHLQVTSPCRDAGDPAVKYNDLDGSRNDMGADGGPNGIQELLAPYAVATANPAEGDAPLSVTLDGSASTDDSGIVSYSWDFDARDGIQAEALGSVVQHQYTVPNSYTATLTVTNSSGRSAQATAVIRVTSPIPPVNHIPTASASSVPIAGPTPLSVQFTGAGSDPDADPLTFGWMFGDGASSSEQNPLHTYTAANGPGAYRATFTVADTHNASAEARVPLTITESEVLAAGIVQPSAGGTVTVTGHSESSLNGAWVTAPPGAMSEPLALTICDVSETLPLPRSTMGTVLRSIELGPTGMIFSRPLTVSVPVASNVDPARLYLAVWYNRATSSWSTQGISGVRLVSAPSPAVVFETTHFTVFAVGQAWDFKSLGTLGGTASYAWGINNANQIAGDSFIFASAGYHHAFRWDASHGIADLGALGRQYSFAFGISDSNQITGFLQPGASFNGGTTFIWDATNGLQDLGALGGIFSMGLGINASGKIVGQVFSTSDKRRAFLWEPAKGVLDLGTLGGESSFATAINTQGQVVGAAQNASGVYRAFLWSSGSGMQDLGALGGSSSEADAINATGQVVGSGDDASGKRHAFFWDSTNGMQDLGVLDAESSVALGINDTAQVVGNLTYPDKTTQGFFWERENGVGRKFLLNQFLGPNFGKTIAEARGINNAGAITGQDGKLVAFILRK